MTATITISKDAFRILMGNLVTLITEHQKARLAASKISGDVSVFVETGRKFDKVLIKENNETSVRFFVEHGTGNIYGAKSAQAPNKNWYFGKLERAQLWNWSGFHPFPVNDDKVRATKHYGPYIIYQEV